MGRRRNTNWSKKLLSWYQQNQRDLPWRTLGDPYAVWISECMLQQTQVSTVIEYFNRWMHRFPDVATLASAEPDEVLRLWAGLGYYTRAKNLHAAAKVIVRDFGGKIPDKVDLLQSLPGIGRYTAGAIASIAFGEVAPIVDGNVRRVLSRMHGQDLGDSQCWALALQLVEDANGHAGDCNQAMMELGATVCTRHRPSCQLCPLSSGCKGLRGGDPQQFPRPRRPANVKTIDRLAVAIERKQRWLLLKRPLNGLWPGMWEFPQLVPERSVPIEGLVREKFGLEVRIDGRFATFSHTLTHRKVNFRCYRAHAVSGRLRRDEYQHHRWIRADALGTMPMAAYGDKMVKIMQDTLFIDR